MKEGQYDPQRIVCAMRSLEEYFGKASPEIWRVLKDPGVGLSFKPEALEYSFLPDDKDVFERMAMPPSLAILKGAASAARYNIKLRCGLREVAIEAT
jgi:hypothetical protein